MSAIDDILTVIRQIGRAAREYVEGDGDTTIEFPSAVIVAAQKYADSKDTVAEDVLDTTIDTLGDQIPDPFDPVNAVLGATAIAGVTIGPFEDLFESLIGSGPRLLEEDVIQAISDPTDLEPGNLEDTLDEITGSATEDVIAGLILIEVVRRTNVIDLEPYEEILAQFFLATAFDDVYGRELEGYLEEGLDPAIAQQANKDTRSTQADLQDFVEANLRMKSYSGEAETRGAPPQNPLDGALSEQDLGYLPDPDTYGLIEGQERLLELAGLEAREPEEIIEEPVQYGIPVPKSVVETEADLAGMPENAKRVYTEVIDQLPQSENLIQEYTRLTEFTFRLREGVQEARFTPQVAQQVIQPELLDLLDDAIPQRELQADDRTAEQVASDAAAELGRNFELLTSIPGDPPSLGDLQAFYEKGIISSGEFTTLYDQYGGLKEFQGEYLQEGAVDKGAESIVRQEALGRITTTDANFQLQQIGFTGPEVAELLSGTPPEQIITSRVTEDPEDTGIALGTVDEIGDTRASQLRLVGIENSQDVANAAISNAQFLVEQAG